MFLLRPKRSLFYCLDTYVIRDKGCISYCCQEGNLPSKVQVASDAGYSAIELWHPDVLKFEQSGGKLSDLQALLEKLNLEVPSYKVVSNIFEGDRAAFESGLAQAEVLFEKAAQINVKSVVVKIINDEYQGAIPPITSVIYRYGKLLDLAAQYKIDPALEFMSLAPGYNNLRETCEVVRRVEKSNAKIVLDTFHLWRKDDAGFSEFQRIVEEGRLDPQWISVVHFTDTSSTIPQDEQKDEHRRLPGDGILNLHKFVKLLKQIQFRGYLSLNTYDRSLWDRPMLEVATEGLYKMNRIVNASEFAEIKDSPDWRQSQEVRCDGLWSRDYLTHLDPRTKPTNRDTLLANSLRKYLVGKKVLDFKCGFSPLAEYVSVGFDAFQGCIDYLTKRHPQAQWLCTSDERFALTFREKIDVLLHLGLGDSDTEVDSCLKVRENCRPELVILECCANEDGTVNDAKTGSAERWERLKAGLLGYSLVIKTDMPKRSTRLLFVGKPTGAS